LGVAWAAWHTLVGVLPANVGNVEIGLRFEDERMANADIATETSHPEEEDVKVSHDATHGDALVLWIEDEHFSLAYGTSVKEAKYRAKAGLTFNFAEVARARLDFYTHLPSLNTAPSATKRLFKKCVSVMKVNTLAPEGVVQQPWSTPDRVPHRDMWLWDSVFHALAMNVLCPSIAFDFLKSVLEMQRDDGMIPHQSSPSGKTSRITQPPLLAWGIWEHYIAFKQDNPTQARAHLIYALPRLERYLAWNLENRDRNHNNLLEWFIEGNPLCRSGESGLDNSPRFDDAVLLDAVDFSVFQAQDMQYVAHICHELGFVKRAEMWKQRAAAMRQAIHTQLWDETQGFYYDVDFAGDFSQTSAVTGFLPLLLEDIPKKRVALLIQKLKDPTQFNTAFPIPSVAVSDPRWSTDMWRGATWINLNYLVIQGLRQQHRETEAQWLTEKTITYVNKYYERFGVLFEFFDAKDEVPPTQCDRKGPPQEPYNIRHKMDAIRDYHWTAALVARLLLKHHKS
jgi:glycogen debranching enzyme